MTVLFIDGRTGSGKTELATAIAQCWPEVQVLHMDDLYPGWRGLAAGSAYLLEVLASGRYERWNWLTKRRAESHRITRPLIVEGVGCLTRATRRIADYAVWVELDEQSRKARVFDRDDNFGGNWDVWAAQEDTHIEREHPAQLADTIVFGHDVHLDVGRWRRLAEAKV